MGFFNKQEPYEPQDLLCVFQENGTANIAPVTEVNDERIYAESLDGNFAVPLGDVKSFTGPKGRIFLYPTTVENVADCQRLAALERSIVLRQITHFAPEAGGYEEKGRLPLFKIAAAIILGIVILIMLISLV